MENTDIGITKKMFSCRRGDGCKACRNALWVPGQRFPCLMDVGGHEGWRACGQSRALHCPQLCQLCSAVSVRHKPSLLQQSKCQTQGAVVVKVLYGSIFDTFIFQLLVTCACYIFINGFMPPYMFTKLGFTAAFECTTYNGK